MKALRVAILTLVLLMAAGLANSVYLTARCDDWTARLNAVTSAAERLAGEAELSPHHSTARGDQQSRYPAAPVRPVREGAG